MLLDTLIGKLLPLDYHDRSIGRLTVGILHLQAVFIFIIDSFPDSIDSVTCHRLCLSMDYSVMCKCKVL